MTAEYISTHDHAYNFLVYYFLPELSETEFDPSATAGDECFPVSQYMAALLPHEPHYSEIIRRIQSTQKVRGDE
ncbi:MAG: hypothetical protein IJ466_05905 [Clostridia bacterium]|nr:hypothetical protein [Clostridia bacterium]